MNRLDAVIISESTLLTALQTKSMEKLGCNDYMDIFLAFKNRVSQDTKFIVRNFPEYTPHDEEHHLRRLIFLADELLGKELIHSLNATELLVLCLSIFGHDWGMAVSDGEMKAISDNSAEGTCNFALINSEHSRFLRYLSKLNKTIDDVNAFDWQEYIRLTHAERSAQRVRSYFKNLDNGIGEAAARICIGHWLDFKNIRDTNMYPVNYAVKNERINLRAVTLYLRLIDLFDISNERTPYIIYKYTAPQSYRSKMEWAKHYSINSLAIVDFQGGRMIQVDGQTDDYVVYAELEDLRNFCKEQLAGCNDLLHEVHDKRYHLNIFDLRWNVIANGFDPISIKFQFDRSKMFDVLSEEIYKGDKYVFIRELLQNSIDAIKLRKEWIELRTNSELANFGKIEIHVDNVDEDTINITVSDDGIGMDLYVIENYLSIAGKSYYSSEEFKRLGLKMDPISRFGVGILSCFMVSDKIQIRTLKDPIINKEAKFLTIDIPYVDHQFRVVATDPFNEKIGTSISVAVSREKIKNRLNEATELEVTTYLKNLVGQIDFPIVVTENNKQTIIISPDQNLEFISKRFPDADIHKLNTVIDFSQVFFPQSLKLAKKHFRIEEFDISKLTGLKSITGKISYVIPHDPFLKVRSRLNRHRETDLFLISQGKRSQDRRIKVFPKWTEYEFANMPGNYKYGASSYSTEPYKVYLDGIIIPKAVPPAHIEGAYDFVESRYFPHYTPKDRFAVPYTVVQFTKNALRHTDISRTEMVQDSYLWDEALAKSLFDQIIEDHREKLMDTDLKKRLMYMIYLTYFFRVPLFEITSNIGLENCPFLMINDKGAVVIEIWGNFKNNKVFFQPLFTYWFKQMVLKELDENYTNEGPTYDWQGDEFVIGEIDYPYFLDVTTSSQAILASKIGQLYLTQTHTFHSYRFLESPWVDGPPMIQAVWIPDHEVIKSEETDFIQLAANDIKSLAAYSVGDLVDDLFSLLEDNYFDVFPTIAVFQEPYSTSIAYGIGILNFNHDLTKGLLRILANIQLYTSKKTIVSAEWGQLIDKVLELPFFDPNTYFDEEFSLDEINLIISEINKMISSSNLIENYQDLPKISLESFVDETILRIDDDRYCQFFNNADYLDYGPKSNYSKVVK
ncbi:ATP-binding protein [Chryseobacterium sp. AG363]|uniref:HD domain-containing protein n=1 Tax=Chryseobacterium sp. AG363 TaxID=2183997 RepID=UPI000E7269FF|nr:ATP-binding protein [Chryseobacterium sp. AG363]RKE81581.1 histidine kinase/DNA gyrase B/HSP90-like ATPase [Chryseobacterium sp. AG363]